MSVSTLQIHLMGEFRLVYGDREVTHITAKPLQLLVAYLVLHCDRTHSRKQLAAILFPTLSESEARTRLRQTLHRLHQAFPEIDQFIASDIRTLRWKPESPYTLDISEQSGELLPSFDNDWIQEKRNQLSPSQPQPVAVQNRNSEVFNPIYWGDAPDVSLFYGRVEEVQTVQQWILQEHCRLVALLGMGGIGKTTLAVKVAQELSQDFELIIWRSLRNAPPLEILLTDLVPFLSRQADTDARLSRLVHWLRDSRCLLILDNVETVLQGGKQVGQYRAGYEDYGELFRYLAESSHQSTVILTSREKPAEVGMYEGAKVRSLHLTGSQEAAIAISESKGLIGTSNQKQHLCQLYSNNPLALKLVASSIQELFDGEIGLFLEQNTVIFQTVRRLLDQQFQRLTELEQTVMYWLAINREWTSISELETDLVPSVARMKLLEALESLRWRSLIEKRSGKYTQQPVVMEYVSDRFTEQISSELITHEIDFFDRYALVKTTVKDYVRQSQFRLIADVIADQLKATWVYPEAIEQQTQISLQCLREKNLEAGYGGGNLINLCYSLGIELTNYNFSNLSIRHACLQQINLHHANLSNTRFTQCLFNQNFSTILAVAFSPNDAVLATGDIKGQLCLWDVQAGQSLMMLQGHLSRIYAVAWHPHKQLLASGGDDQRIKIWDSQTGICLNTLEGHRSAVWSLAWSPDGKILASTSNDRTLKLWNQSDCIQTLEGHQNLVTSVAWSPNGKILATGSDDQTVKLWDVERGHCLYTLEVTGNLVRAIAWSPNSQFLAASANQDLLIRIWDTETGQCVQTLAGHSRQIYSLAWNPDGTEVASASDDGTIKLWNPVSGQCLKTLTGHENGIWAIAWSHNGILLASGSQDETIRLWEAETGQCVKALRGYSSVVRCVNWSPDGKQLVSGSADRLVRIWDVDTGKCLKTLRGHQGWVFSAAWSPDGRTIASSSSDHTIKLWDALTGHCRSTLMGHRCWVWSVAYSPDGAKLATGSSTNDLTIRIWDARTGECLHVLSGHLSWIWYVVWSADSKRVASGGNDQTVRIWDVGTGKCLQTLHDASLVAMSIAWKPQSEIIATGSLDRAIKLWDLETGECVQSLIGHHSVVSAIAWHPQGHLLVSGSSDRMIKLWDLETGKCIQTLQGHQGLIWSVCFNPDGNTIVSGSEDQTIRIWNIHTGQCLHTLRGDRPYEGMNIAGVTGLTEAQKATLRALGAIEQ